MNKNGIVLAPYLSSSLTISGWTEIENLPAPQTVATGRTLLARGTDPARVVLIRSGSVKLERVDQAGHAMIVGIRSTGWMLGAEDAILGLPNAYTAVTLTPCEISVYRSAEFTLAMSAGGSLSRYASRVLSFGMSAHLGALVELRSETAEERLDHFLASIRALGHAQGAQSPDLSQVEVAQVVGVTPEHLCRLMSRKRKQ